MHSTIITSSGASAVTHHDNRRNNDDEFDTEKWTTKTTIYDDSDDEQIKKAELDLFDPDADRKGNTFDAEFKMEGSNDASMFFR